MTACFTGRVWEEASSPRAAQAVERFEKDWRRATSRNRPDPLTYLGGETGSGSGTLLALLRAEMTLRWEAGEPTRAESILDRMGTLLDEETQVGVVYEEFCLREESAGEPPAPAEFYQRFPSLEARLRRVLEIHDLVGSSRTVSFATGLGAGVTFPEVGQTIGGFHLVDELGRGAFARVFRAQERQLADRPVALKVARTGSREPQTLARLQHTHIVPVYSYRVDQATGLHLLCMPYLGGVTLSRLLEDGQVRGMRSGRELLTALDAVEPGRTYEPESGAAGRVALGSRSFARAVAWWGARMAEALQHAHERGVLHRDVKPSNVLVTPDGLPMLLDFNLAWETHLDESEMTGGGPGGTLAYMSPEHLDALSEGRVTGLDRRSDLYSLGVLLYEVLAERPFEGPRPGGSVREVLRRASEQRRHGAVPIRRRRADVPPELEAVLLKCLAPEPEDRYQRASDLAVDLQRVADDEALCIAREPLASRSVRWLRRNRNRVALALPLLLAPAVAAYSLAVAEVERAEVNGRVIGEVNRLITEGGNFIDHPEDAPDNAVALARAQFENARKMGDGVNHPDLALLEIKARDKYHAAVEIQRERRAADDLFDQLDELWVDLLGFQGPSGTVSDRVEQALAPFFVLSTKPWWLRSELTQLDRGRRERLRVEVDDLLFLWAAELEQRGGDTAAWKRAREICELGLRETDAPGPWMVLADRCDQRLRGADPGSNMKTPTSLETASSRASFRWGVLLAKAGNSLGAIHAMERAVQQDQGRFWYHFYLGYLHKQGEVSDTQALAHYNTAIALRPDLPWPRFNRARLYMSQSAWDRALRDLDAALVLTQGRPQAPIWLNRGLVKQSVGDYDDARACYDRVLQEASEDSLLGRAARHNLASMEAQMGFVDRAIAAYDLLLATRPDDLVARTNRALLALRAGRPAEALQDLDQMLIQNPDQAALREARALAHLSIGNVSDALVDAAEMGLLASRPAGDRLFTRTLLAAGQVDRLYLNDPEELSRLPMGGRKLLADLEHALTRLEELPEDDTRAQLNRAVILEAVGRRDEAMATADAAVLSMAESATPWLVRARIRQREGQLEKAYDDVRKGLSLEPDDLRLLALRGRLRVRMGQAESGLNDLDAVLRRGTVRGIHTARAEALLALGRPREAVDSWNAAISLDPEDPEAMLGRAEALIRLELWDQVFADLENAASRAFGQPELLGRIALAYGRCLRTHPDRIDRVLNLGRRSLESLVRKHASLETSRPTSAN